MKASKYSNTLQVNNKWRYLNCIDPCIITNYAKFDFCTKILQNSESTQIKYRPGINELSTKILK